MKDRIFKTVEEAVAFRSEYGWKNIQLEDGRWLIGLYAERDDLADAEKQGRVFGTAQQANVYYLANYWGVNELVNGTWFVGYEKHVTAINKSLIKSGNA
jgi:hypothetical protein